MSQFVYNAPTIVRLTKPFSEKRNESFKGLEYTLTVWMVYLEQFINVQLDNLTEHSRELINRKYGEEVSKMENPVVQMQGLIDCSLILKGDPMTDQFRRFFGIHLTEEDIWNAPLMMNGINETHEITLKNLKDKDLAKFIYNTLMRYVVEKDL